MVERAYSIKHLSTNQLRELYCAYRPHGWLDADYYALKPTGVNPPQLSEAEIIMNINADNEENYFVFMLDYEDEEDGVMIGFGMSYHPDFAVYLHLPPELLDELIEKYSLCVSHDAEDHEMKDYHVKMEQISLN